MVSSDKRSLPVIAVLLILLLYPASAQSGESSGEILIGESAFSESQKGGFAEDNFVEFRRNEEGQTFEGKSQMRESLIASYTTPSFEGYSQDHSIYARIFSQLDKEFNSEEIMQNCDNPEKISELVIGRARSNIKDFESLC